MAWWRIREMSGCGLVVNESEISHWMSVESETIQSLACRWISGTSVSQWLDCEQDRTMLLSNNLYSAVTVSLSHFFSVVMHTVGE